MKYDLHPDNLVEGLRYKMILRGGVKVVGEFRGMFVRNRVLYLRVKTSPLVKCRPVPWPAVICIEGLND